VPALRGLSLEIPPGRHLGLVGPSGSGKSSLLKVLARMWPASGGEMLLDGRPLRTVPEERLRAEVAYVPQRPQLFDGTIAANIRLAGHHGDRERAGLLQDAGLGEWLATSPAGLDTPVGPGETLLSHGERQVVYLLRAPAKRPRLVLLDEPTSNVDAATDAYLVVALRRLLQGVTCVMIAHRLHTVRRLDRIAVLRAGRITELGGHHELLGGGRRGRATAPGLRVRGGTAGGRCGVVDAVGLPAPLARAASAAAPGRTDHRGHGEHRIRRAGGRHRDGRRLGRWTPRCALGPTSTPSSWWPVCCSAAN
jgi:ABC-type multidrug transport system fused ATPase/permease subunit